MEQNVVEPKRLKFWHLAIVLTLFVFACTTTKSANSKDGLLKVYFLDVGQGDAILVEAPNGNKLLIDGGPDNKILSELPKYTDFYDRTIDVVVLTHHHADHLTGLLGVLDRYDVKNIVDTKDDDNSPQSQAWKQAEEKEGATITEAIAGKVIDLGSGVQLKIIYPDQTLAGHSSKNLNNDSVVSMLVYGQERILFEGDSEKPVEHKLVLGGADLQAQVLKIGHHGSKTSSTEEFLKAVNPLIGFIEVGKNNIYHLPSPEILKRLENSGIKYYRTDADGDVEIESDGRAIQIIKK